MVTIQIGMRMRRENDCNSMMDLHRMWTTDVGPSDDYRYQVHQQKVKLVSEYGPHAPILLHILHK